MKKVLVAALSLLMVLVLAACGATETSAPAPEPASEPAPVLAAGAGGAAADASAPAEDAPESITITHDLGQVDVPYDPQRIAVLDLSVLDMLDAWDLGGRVVGMPKDSQVSYLTAYIDDTEIVHLGSLKEVDMEALNSLQPDVIFIGGRLSSEYDSIAAIAPTVLLTIDNEAGYMKGFTQNVDTIASIFGMEEQAKELLAGFDARIAALSEAAAGKSAVVGLVTSGSFNTLGNGSRCSLICGEVGFENVAADVDSTHGDSASFELLLEKNPDYIFVLDRDTAIAAEGSAVAREVMENEIVMKTDAYQNGQIVYLTPDVWYLAEGGITATDTMLKDLEGALL